MKKHLRPQRMAYGPRLIKKAVRQGTARHIRLFDGRKGRAVMTTAVLSILKRGSVFCSAAGRGLIAARLQGISCPGNALLCVREKVLVAREDFSARRRIIRRIKKRKAVCMLIRWLEKRTERMGDARSALGKAASIVGVGVNALLFAIKALAGVLSGSLSITADAFNNLSDASSSIVSLLGFKLADKPADAEHPYGHGRYEYLSALMVAVMIIVIGVELLKSSVEKILHPTPVSFSLLTLAILVVSICGKLWLCAFNRTVGGKIGSSALIAAAHDSRNDVIATAAVLLSVVIARLTGLALDGFMGAGVAVFILVSGFNLVRDTIDPMLGSMPDQEEVEHIRDTIMRYPGVLGIHDLMVHDYGPGRQFASVHVEMSAQEDPLVSHDVIDNIEHDFLKNEGLHLVVHYDPVATDDPRLPVMHEYIMQLAQDIHPGITIHDLRIVPGASHTNVVFDCVLPYEATLDERAVRRRIADQVAERYPCFYCVITTERSYVKGD